MMYESFPDEHSINYLYSYMYHISIYIVLKFGCKSRYHTLTSVNVTLLHAICIAIKKTKLCILRYIMYNIII